MRTTNTKDSYSLLPLRFARVPLAHGKTLVTSETGEFLFLENSEFEDLVNGRIMLDTPLAEDLEARHLLVRTGASAPVRRMAAQIRSRKAFIRGGPALHAFILTLRCDHACQYCQVTPRGVEAASVDMDEATAEAAVDLMFQSPSPELCIEFQGGEPLLAFDRVRSIIERVVERNQTEGRSIRFVIATTMHGLTDPILDFLRTHGVHLSTSLDGPSSVHNANRPNRARDSYERTVASIRYAREALGHDKVAALVTLTRRSLNFPREIVDCYVENEFQSIFLRPLSRYGFAAKAWPAIGYDVPEFLDFYRVALKHLLYLNAQGVTIEEAYASTLLTSILTPFAHHYVDLRSPTGGGLGALVYHCDGTVYPADEARMLAEMGDTRLGLGTVHTPYHELMRSPAMEALLNAGVAESLPECADCVFVPYCGADPLDALSRQGDLVGHRPTSAFCAKQKGVLGLLFEYLYEGDDEVIKTFLSWIGRRGGGELELAGYRG